MRGFCRGRYAFNAQGGKGWGSSSPSAPQNDEMDSSLALRMTR